MQITVNGRKVTVGDNFATLPRDQQDKTVDEIAAAMAPQAYPAKPNLGSIPMFGPALSAMGFNGVPSIDTAPDAWQTLGQNKPGIPFVPQPVNEMIRSLYPFEENTVTGDARVAAPPMFKQMFNAGQLPGEIMSGQTPFDPRVSMSEQDPTTLSRGELLAGMVAGRPSLKDTGMVPMTVHGMVDASGKAMPTMVADALEKAGVTPKTLAPRLGAMGPGAVVGDLSPQLQARLGAVATTPGIGQDMIVEAMRARQLGANSRIKTQIGENLGPEPIPSRVRAEMDNLRKAANKGYEPAFYEKSVSSTPFYDAKPVIDAIDAQLPGFVGNSRAQLQAVRQMLFDPSGQPIRDPQVALAVRHELDGMIGALEGPGANSTTKKALEDLRAVIDEDLAGQVPGLKANDAKFAEVAAQKEAYDYGFDVLKGGQLAVHPVDLADKLAKFGGPHSTLVGPSGPSLAPFRVSQGTLSDIYRIVGTTANDRVALKQVLQGEGSWNREKLTTLFGPQKAQKLIDLLNNEATMQATEQMAFGGSKTATLQGAKEGIAADRSTPGFVKSAANLKAGDAAASLLDSIAGGYFKTAREKRNAQLAAALLSQGGWRPGTKTAAFIEGVVRTLPPHHQSGR